MSATAPAHGTDTSTPVLRQQKDGIVRLTLNRPAQRNSLSEATMTALQEAFDAIAADPTAKVVILGAEGPAFCAGHDLKELTARRADPDRGRAYFQKILAQCSQLMQTIVRCPKPVIARVHGIATAAGCQLVASCDLAIAADTARFATPGVNIGLFCSTPMVALSRAVHRKHALEMLLLGEMVSAPRAAEMGLINKAVAADQLDSEIDAWAQTVASKSSLTVAIGKEAFTDQLEKPLNEAYDYATEVMVRNMMARDAEEGIGAFIEKRDPKWENR